MRVASAPDLRKYSRSRRYAGRGGAVAGLIVRDVQESSTQRSRDPPPGKSLTPTEPETNSTVEPCEHGPVHDFVQQVCPLRMTSGAAQDPNYADCGVPIHLHRDR